MQLTVSHLSLSLLVVGSASARLLTDPSQLRPQYDFVVVGGGTAGNLVAARLSEKSSFSVLVIEAGGNDAGVLATEIPYTAPNTLSNLSLIWNYQTVVQPGLNNRVISYPRGRVLGGSSSVNFLVYTRGSRNDFDRMAKVTGDSGWSWNKMLPYFKKSEGFTRPVDRHNTQGQITSDMHGTTGSLLTTVYAATTPIDGMLFNTTRASPSEFPFNQDGNSGNTIGMSYIQSTAGNGIRSSSSTAFLQPNINRPNLDVLINSQVMKLLNSASKNKTPDLRTVQFAQSRNGPRFTVKAIKEVILSAGAINTPQILLLSGVGNPTDLRKLGIDTVVNSPFVGQNLQDHPLIGSQWFANTTDTLDVLSENSTAAATALAQWVTTKYGRLANVSGNLFAWLRASSSLFNSKVKDPSAGPSSAHFELFPANQFASFAVPSPPTGFFISVIKGVVSPASRGTVTLHSVDPFDFPLIDLGFLSDPLDVQFMLAAIKAAKAMFALAPWKGYVLQPFGVLGAAKTDNDIIAYIRSQASTFFHPASTVKAGALSDSTAPLDASLKLKGAVGVRVVDASVFPYIPASHLQAPVYAVAERASDLIKGSW